MWNCYESLRNRYHAIEEYLKEFWEYVNEDRLYYQKIQRQRLEEKIERVSDKTLVESTQKSLGEGD